MDILKSKNEKVQKDESANIFWSVIQRAMNSIRNRAEEIVLRALIYKESAI